MINEAFPLIVHGGFDRAYRNFWVFIMNSFIAPAN